MPITKRNAINSEVAESLAIQALAFLAQEPERLGRFLAITGVGPDGVRAAAREPGFLAAVLEYLAGDEPLLIKFAAQLGVDPADIARAENMLAHGPPGRDSP